MRQRGGMGRASVPGPSMAAERGRAGRGGARAPAQCEAARRGGAGEVEERASPLRARPSATPHASVGPAAHVRQRSARPSAAVVTRRTDHWPGPGTVCRSRGVVQVEGPDGPSGGVAGAHVCTVRPPRASIGTRASVSRCLRFCAGSTERICWPVSVVRGARLYLPLCAHHMSTCAVRNVKHG